MERITNKFYTKNNQMQMEIYKVCKAFRNYNGILMEKTCQFTLSSRIYFKDKGRKINRKQEFSKGAQLDSLWVDRYLRPQKC